MALLDKKCVVCEGGVPRLGPEQIQLLLPEIQGWKVTDQQRRLEKRFVFRDFVAAMKFVNAMADIAESEGHHPDFSVRWNTVDVTLNTHVIDGLHENDFILAAKVDHMLGQMPAHDKGA
jgi:4a-hydroxytetrahydrobiopterin dehydratase